ncbi:MAG: TetR/AcrR family transcriptional regulator [Clostridia bacterium]|nr:TetR/AcrR family transcriptional regulator [Clostridia bacterium]
MEKTDLRIIRTKKAIRQAFAELMSIKPLETITVSDVAAEALINRKTFYAHYSGVHEIIAEMEDEIVSALGQLLADKRFEDILKSPYDFFRDVMQIINRDIDVYGRLLTVSGNSNLVHKMIQMIRRQICAAYKKEAPVDEQTLDLVVHFMLSGLLAVFAEWYNSGRNQSIEELSEKLSKLCFDGIHGVMRMAGADNALSKKS